MDCPLCTIRTRNDEIIHYEDNEIIIADAKTKKGHRDRIMLIIKSHSIEIPHEKEEEYIKKFTEIAKPIFSWTDEFYIFGWNHHRKAPTIEDHWHKIASDKNENCSDFDELFCQPREDLIKVEVGQITS